MAGLKEIRTRLTSVEATMQLTSAMKMVSASKLRKAQNKQARLREYIKEIAVIYKAIMDSEEEDPDVKAFLEGRSKTQKVLLIVFTGNKGLCGSYNNHLCKAVNERLSTKYAHLEVGKDVELLCMGSKGAEYFRKKGYNLYENLFGDDTEKMEYEQIAEIANKIVKEYNSHKFGMVEVIYYHPVNAVVQDLRIRRIMPAEDFFKNPLLQKEKTKITTQYIMQPSRGKILQELLPKLFSIGLYFILESSRVSEHGSRMTAMSKASDNADELIHVLNRQYNKLRQSAITNELLEIVSGANALK